MKITLYSKPDCIKCRLTKRFLHAHHLRFIEHDLTIEPQFIDQLKQAGYQSLPVVQVDKQPAFVGFNPERLNQLILTSPH